LEDFVVPDAVVAEESPEAAAGSAVLFLDLLVFDDFAGVSAVAVREAVASVEAALAFLPFALFLAGVGGVWA
jgi:hypothetical protein